MRIIINCGGDVNIQMKGDERVMNTTQTLSVPCLVADNRYLGNKYYLVWVNRTRQHNVEIDLLSINGGG